MLNTVKKNVLCFSGNFMFFFSVYLKNNKTVQYISVVVEYVVIEINIECKIMEYTYSHKICVCMSVCVPLGNEPSF